jgi:hypothetical protein
MNPNNMNINDDIHVESLHSRLQKLLADVKNFDRNPANQNMRGQLINRVQSILPEFNNEDEIDAGHNGILSKEDYFNLLKQDLESYLEYQYENNVNQIGQSIVREVLDIFEQYMPQQPAAQGGGRRHRKMRKTRKGRKGTKARKRSKARKSRSRRN